MKTCIVCLESLALNNFYQDKKSKDKKQSRCKQCHNKSSASSKAFRRKTRTKEEKEKQYEWQRQWHYKNTYGISLEDYNVLLEIQNNTCAICNKPPTKHKRLAVDHCHKEGHVRGLLCTSCNVGLGNFKDNTGLLLKAVEYLGG